MLVGVAELDDLAHVHHRDPRGEDLHDAEVVADEQAGEALLALELLEQVEHLGLHRDVERRGRLVGHEQVGLEGEGAGDADALALTTGELVGVAVPEAALQVHAVEQSLDLACSAPCPCSLRCR